MPMQIPVDKGCVWDWLPGTEIMSKTQVQVSAASLKRNQAGEEQKGTRTIAHGRGKLCFQAFILGAK